MKRSIAAVLGEIIHILKENGVDAHGLEKIRYSHGYTAPEMQGHLWEAAEVWMTKNLPDPRGAGAPEWAARVADIFSGRPAKKRFHVTVLRVEVLSEGEPYGQAESLADIAHEISEGECVGRVIVENTMEVTEEHMRKILRDANADPDFFGP